MIIRRNLSSRIHFDKGQLFSENIPPTISLRQELGYYDIETEGEMCDTWYTRLRRRLMYQDKDTERTRWDMRNLHDVLNINTWLWFFLIPELTVVKSGSACPLSYPNRPVRRKPSLASLMGR